MFVLPEWQYKGELNNIDLNINHPPVKVYVPARFDFIGGWTDTPPYYFDNPSAVLNASIDCLGIEIAINDAPQLKLIYNNEEQTSNLPITSSLQFLRFIKPKIKIVIKNTIPRGSGLGGSSLLICGFLKAIFSYYGVEITNLKLVNYTLEIEQIMGSGGGWQDQIGGMFSGIKFIQTSPSSPATYKIQKIEGGNFEDFCLLIDTNVQREAINILASIRYQYFRGDKDAIKMLGQIRKNALLGWDLLKTKRYEDFGKLMTESWQRVCEVENSSKIELVDVIQKIIGKDLAGLKIGGAGGGGFIMAVLKNAERREAAIESLQEKLGKSLRVYRPKFDKNFLA